MTETTDPRGSGRRSRQPSGPMVGVGVGVGDGVGLVVGLGAADVTTGVTGAVATVVPLEHAASSASAARDKRRGTATSCADGSHLAALARPRPGAARARARMTTAVVVGAGPNGLAA